MRFSLAWPVPSLFVLMIGISAGQEPPDRFTIASNAVGCEYDIEIVVPQDTLPPAEKYPIAYCLDWYVLDDYLTSLPRLMALGRLTVPYILVGIGQGSTADDWAFARTRDFTPAPPTDEYSRSNMYPRALEATGGAARFVSFLEEELLPRIESEYPADPSCRCLVGYSLGGLLGLHALIERPHLFQYFILGSPSLWFNEYCLSSELENLSPNHLRAFKRVYMSVGEDESWEMLKSFGMLRSAFHREDAEGVMVKAEIVRAAGHVGAMPISLYNGFRFVFQREQ